LIFRFMPANSGSERQRAEGSRGRPNLFKPGPNDKRIPIIGSAIARIDRREFAEVWSGTSGWSDEWDQSDEMLLTFGERPIDYWSNEMRTWHFEELHICDDDFAEWWKTSAEQRLPIEPPTRHAAIAQAELGNG